MNEEMQNIMDLNEIENQQMLMNQTQGNGEQPLTQKQRNNRNNTELAKNALDAASNKSGKVGAIAKVAKGADKLTNGAITKGAGKAMSLNNKMLGLQGKVLQKAANYLSESGTGQRISSALGKKNSIENKSNAMTNFKSGKDNSSGETNIKDRTEEETDNKGYTSFAASFKAVKIGMIVFCGVIFPIVIFCVCFISASQTFLSAVGLSEADNVSNAEAEEKINNLKEEDLNQEIKDEQAYDIYIQDEKSIIFKNSKLNKTNIIQVANKKFDENLIEQLKDFYPSVSELSENYDENLVYDFFLKMNKLYMNYFNVYNVELDLALLMATLQMQSSDMNIIFNSNLGSLYRTNNLEDIPVNELDYYYDWSNYKLSRDNSEHDMEVLAQHMISIKTEGACVKPAQDGKCYVINMDKYREFLKQFLEKKYYLEGEYYIEYENDNLGEIATPDDESSNKDNDVNLDEGEVPNYAEGLTFVEGGINSEIYYYNQNDYQGYYYSKDPYNLAVYKTSLCERGIGDCYQSIRSSGCGPTSLSIAVSTFLNEAHNPIELTTKVCSYEGACTPDGTYRWALAKAAEEYGFNAYETTDVQKVINELSTGNSIVIARAGRGDFTRNGHYINITAVNNNEQFYIIDCNNPGNNHWWSASRIIEQVTAYVVITR